jgi:hypothetical protein
VRAIGHGRRPSSADPLDAWDSDADALLAALDDEGED